MIHVIATIELHPGRRADFLREFHRIVPAVLAENGCLDYGPTVDLATGLSARRRSGVASRSSEAAPRASVR